jgi:transposase
MLDVIQVLVLRDKVEREGLSVRRAARDLGISRVTARRYLQEDPAIGERKAPRRASPVLSKVTARMEELLADWATRTTRKQHVTATALHAALLAEDFAVGQTTVRSWLAEYKRQRMEVFVPLQHYAGQMAEVDFFEVVADIAGVRQKAWMLVIRLMHSGRDFVWLYEHADQVSLLDGHVRAFEHFDGVPARLVYDNLKAAVRKILFCGRELQPRFAAMAAHYVFEPSFARPYTGHDKGGVESRGRGVRLQHLVPIPAAPTLREAALALLARVDAQVRKLPDDGSPSKMMKFESKEQPLLVPVLRGPFDPRKLETVPADASARVRLAGARYSVPTSWARCDVEARVGVEEVELRCRGERIVSPRQKKGGDFTNYRHYLPELRRKPQAVRQVMPALLEQFGAPFDRLWRLLVDTHGPMDAARIFARVLGAMLEHGESAVRDSVSAALDQDRMDLLLLLPRRADKRAPPVAVPEGLAGHVVEQPCASQYDALLGGGSHERH